MPRFYFHIQDHDERHMDPDGNVYADPGEAEADAIVTIRSLVQNGQVSLDRIAHWVIHITGEDGVVYHKIPVQHVLGAGN